MKKIKFMLAFGLIVVITAIGLMYFQTENNDLNHYAWSLIGLGMLAELIIVLLPPGPPKAPKS